MKSRLFISYLLGFCMAMILFYRPLKDIKEQILTNRIISYTILKYQDSIKNKMDLADRQRDSIRKEIRASGNNISTNLKSILIKK